VIREWLEEHGWTCVRSDEEGDLYTKGNPVGMNTEAALFTELIEAEAQIGNLAMIVKRLTHRLDSYDPGAIMLSQASTYLKKIGQAGTPLRTELR
jgi:hypothetical protein